MTNSLSRMSMRYTSYTLAILFALMCNGISFGQGFTASVLGVVSDASGAVLTHVPVTATNIDTDVKTAAVTDDRGSYTLLHLTPGNYRIFVELAGFKTSIVGPLKLEVDQRQEQNFKLELGQVSESINVGSSAPAEIQTETATVGGVIDHAQTSELPLNGRNFLELNLLVPGAAQPVKGSQLSTQGGSIEVHGQPENSNYFWVDGLDNTTQTIGQYIVNVPAYSIQEFRIMSPTYDAEFGRTPGANINVITRSGGNSYHGDVYLFIRNSVFDAKNYFDPAGKIPAFRRGQFGGDIGGKVIKDKLFFYGAFEGLTFAQGETAKNIVPSVQNTKGNFSDIATPIIDPKTGKQFLNNVIPQDRINATASTIATYYPAPNQGTNTALVSPIGTDRDNVYIAKADWIISSSDHFNAFWGFEDATFNQPIAQFSANTNIPGFGLTQLGAHDFTTGLSETHIFSPNLLSVIKFGWNRYSFNYFPYARYQDWCGILKIQGCDEGPSNWNMPSVSLNSTYSSLGGASNQTEPGPFDTTFVDPTVTWLKGRHTLKAGYDFHHFFTNFGNGEGPRGTFTFNGTWTSSPTIIDPSTGKPTAGNPLADMLLGLPYQASKTVIAIMPNNGHFLMDMYSNAGFVQDDFKVTPKFTLNLGLRYEYNIPATERRNYMANLDLTRGVPNAILQIAGQNGVSRKLYNADGKQFAPRVGFVYSPMSKTVVRGGYGVFYQLNLENTSQGLHYNAPFSSAYTITGDGKNININNALVTGLVANVPAFSAMAKYYKAGMIMQYSLGFQHEFPAGTLLDVSYVGNRGRDIDAAEPINTPIPGPGAVQGRRDNKNYAGINLSCPCVSSEYDGLEVRAEKHFSRGSSLLLAYTWSRSFDDTGVPQDPRNISGQWGPSTFDIPNHVSVSYVYRLPVGKSGIFLNHMNTIGESVLGGWQLNGIYQYHSGQAFTPILPIDNTNTLLNQDRPNLIGDPFKSSAKCQTRTAACWLNAAAFATPAQYHFGTAGKGEVRGPTFNQLDFAVSKNFAIAESMRFEFRAEAFNILNHPNWDNPGATLSGSFGVITTAESSRQMQFGGRFVF